MYQTLVRMLKQEMALFQAAIENEKEKKRHILSADGKRVQLLTSKSESLIKEIIQIESERISVADRYLTTAGFIPHEQGPTISRLRAAVAKLDTAMLEEFDSLSSQYRITLETLRQINVENGELLSTTNAAIKRVLESIQEKSRKSSETYTPTGRVHDRYAPPLAVNANV